MVIKCIEKQENGKEKISYVYKGNMAAGTLEFTDDIDEAWNADEWNAEMMHDWFAHHYKDKYPQIVNSVVIEY